MSKKFITFKPLTGIYKETMEPYQRMTEKGEMSPLLEIEGSYYRILRTTLDGLIPRKMVVCREDGQIEKSEEISLKCFQFYQYLSLYAFNKKQLSFDVTQGGKSRHKPLIEAFQTMVIDLTPILSIEEQKSMKFHLHYLEEIYRVSALIADSASELLDCGKQIEKLDVDKLSATQMIEIGEMIIKRGLLKNQFEGILYEDGHRARSIVQTILKKRQYYRQISNRNDVHKVLKEMKGDTDASKRFIKEAKKDYKDIEMYLEIDIGPFSIEKLIEETYSGFLREHMNQMNVKNFITRHWNLSSNCIYK